MSLQGSGGAAQSLQESLHAMIGPGVLLESESDAAPFLSDHRGLYTGRALAVALPRDVEEVSKLLAWSHAHGVGVVPQGGNTGYCGGATPDASGLQLVIGLARLKRIRQLDAAGYSMTVEAGCTLGEVQRAAAAAQRFFPLELGSADSCQIGGNLATNAGGLNVVRYGMARALTLGVEAVMADGQVLRHLRALHKDNSGYDLTALLVGSEGTLGVITAATLKLWPQPRSTATAFAAVPSVAAAEELLTVMRTEAGECLSSFELLPRSALDLALRHVAGTGDPLGAVHSWYVLLELSTTSREALGDVLEHALGAAVARGLVADALICANERQRAQLWRLREMIPDAQRRAGPSLKHDVAVPVGHLAEFVAKAGEWLGTNVPEGTLVAYGHAADGNLHFNVSFPADTAATAVAAYEPVIRRAVHDMVVAAGGSFSAEHGVGRLKVGELQRYGDAVRLAMMRNIKQACDPRGILNPGKVLPAS